MGMAASQARLLCITARIHDVEYQAQAIQTAKLQLATQSDAAYREYNEALDASTLTINAIDTKNGSTSIVTATFNNLCSRNRLTGANGNIYALRDKYGRLVVEDEIEEGYYEFQQTGLNDPYQFALFMLNDGKKPETDSKNSGSIFNKYLSQGNIDEFAKLIQQAEIDVYNSLGDNKSERLVNYYEKLLELTGTDSIYDNKSLLASGDKEKIEEYNEALQIFRNELYKRNSNEVNTKLQGTDEEIDTDMFNYYVNIYNQIKLCGGCVSIDDFDGPSEYADAANNSDWLQAMVNSGQMVIEIINTDSKTGEVSYTTTSPNSDSALGYKPTSSIDKTALVKAEAKYEHTLKQIDKKDQQYDLTLSKLETERSALTTEYESVKKVIEENIERTFGIFS